MRGFALGLFALSATLLITVPAHAQGTGAGFVGNFNLFLGSKSLDDTDWPTPWDQQAEAGFVADFKPATWPIGLEVRLLSSESDPTPVFSVVGRTREFDFGVRKTWGAYNMHPYIGGGLASIEGERATGGVSVSGSGGGLWLAGGIYWVLGQHFNLGFDLMASSAQVTIAGADVNAGGGHFNVQLGYHF